MKREYLICLLGLSTLLTQCFRSGQEFQVQRSLNINTGWEFQQVDQDEWKPAEVPGTVQTDLMRLSIIPDPFVGSQERDVQWVGEKDWEYRTTFTIPKDWSSNQELRLEFEGLDTYAEVYLDDELILSADNMFRSWKVPIGTAKPGTSCDLRIVFRSPLTHQPERWDSLGYTLPSSDTGNVASFTRKAPYHFGWDWGPRIITMGIWKPIRLVAVPSVEVQDLYVHTDSLTEAEAFLHFRSAIRSKLSYDSVGLFVVDPQNGAIHHQEVVSLSTQTEELRSRCVLKKPNLWYTHDLGEPVVENLEYVLIAGSDTLVQHPFRLGLRDLELVRMEDSLGRSFSFHLNGKPLYVRGANYIPQDIFLHRVSPSQYRSLIQKAVDANINMIRVWGGGVYEQDLFYDLCDEYGILVWQDFMFACAMYPSDTAYLANVKAEATEQIKRLRTHPSLAIWCGNNESNVAWFNWGWQNQYGISPADSTKIYTGYKRLFEDILPALVFDHDAGRAYIPSSPISNWGTPENFNTGNMHYWGVWHGEESFSAFAENVPRFMSEYGFQSFPNAEATRQFVANDSWSLDAPALDWHQKSYKGNRLIYQHLREELTEPKDLDEMLYLSQVVQHIALEKAITEHRLGKPHCMGTMFWQLNDCWPGPSWSVIDYYQQGKNAFHALKQLYSPIFVHAERDGQNVKFTVVYDLHLPVNTRLDIHFHDTIRNTYFHYPFSQKIKANGKLEYNLSLSDKHAPLNWNHTVVETAVRMSHSANQWKKVCERRFFFKDGNRLEVVSPHIAYNIEPEGDQIRIDLKSSGLYRNVSVRVIGHLGTFNDNYFSLLKHEERTIYFQPNDNKMLDPKTVQLEFLALE